jgi:methionyl-tRNA formyltransferase
MRTQRNKETYMKVLLLGPERPAFIDFLRQSGDEPKRWEDALTEDSPVLRDTDYLVSYGYRHILSQRVLDLFPDKALNLHVAYLPWNRGADPNFWSLLECSPKGVTIHALDAGIDTGDILFQEEVAILDEDTLKTSYQRLSDTIERLFYATWAQIRSGSAPRVRQPAGGSFHLKKHRAAYEHLLVSGWDTPVRDLVGKALSGPRPTL